MDVIKAAGVIFVTPQRKALFLKRSDTGEWCWPGGTQEEGETTEQCALRECVEEIGDVPEGNLVPFDHATTPVDFTTFIQKVGEQFTPTLNHEHTEWRWLPLTEPPEPLHPGVADTLSRASLDTLDAAQTTTLTTPLLIRLLEWAREEVKTDLPLHVLAERMAGGTLDAEDFTKLIQGINLSKDQETAMPLTSKGEKILAAMVKTYGSEEKARSVLYASKNAGKISGIDEGELLDSWSTTDEGQQALGFETVGTTKRKDDEDDCEGGKTFMKGSKDRKIVQRDPMGREKSTFSSMREPDDREWEMAGPLSDHKTINTGLVQQDKWTPAARKAAAEARRMRLGSNNTLGHFVSTPHLKVEMRHGTSKVNGAPNTDVVIAAPKEHGIKPVTLMRGVHPDWDRKKLVEHLKKTHAAKIATAGGVAWHDAWSPEARRAAAEARKRGSKPHPEWEVEWEHNRHKNAFQMTYHRGESEASVRGSLKSHELNGTHKIVSIKKWGDAWSPEARRASAEARKFKAGSVVRLNKPGHTYHGKLAEVLGPHPTSEGYSRVKFHDPNDQTKSGFLNAAIKNSELELRGQPPATPKYNAESVNNAIASSNRSGRRIGGREAKAIHALLKGRHDSLPSELVSVSVIDSVVDAQPPVFDAVVFDEVVIDDGANVRFTDDGYLVACPRVARTGIQLYKGAECGKPDQDVVRVYRPHDSVFATDALHSFAHRPVTLDHPAVPVTADNWKKFAVGQTGDEVLRDGDTVRVPMVLMDKEAIEDYKAGKNQLSMGYTCDIEWVAGVSPEGEPYDAIQRNIRGNHLAIVKAARGGSQLRIGDAKTEVSVDHVVINT